MSDTFRCIKCQRDLPVRNFHIKRDNRTGRASMCRECKSVHNFKVAKQHRQDDGLLLADGFDDALIGLGRRCGEPDLAVYSIPLAIDILMTRDHMTEDDAREYLEFNSIGAWVGKRTPIWVESASLGESR